MALKLPDPFAAIPRFNLLYPFASPIHPLNFLSSSSRNRNTGAGDARVSLYCKREDHASSLACSGNKYRKLEYIVPDILSRQPVFGDGVASESPAVLTSTPKPGSERRITTLVTEGAIQSNHTVQVAATAKKLGLEAVVLLHKATGGGLSAATHRDVFLQTGNVQIDRLLGADVRILDPSSDSNSQDDVVEGVISGLRSEGKSPYWIPSGASLHPLGGLGYARCAFEIAAQERELFTPQTKSNPRAAVERDGGQFDYIFVAAGSGSTIGGLIAGFKLLEKSNSAIHQDKKQRPRKIIGILTSPTASKAYHKERVLRFARQAGKLIGLEDPERDITMSDIHLDDRYVGSAYGVLDLETKEILTAMAEKEQLILDPVYTAKVARGMMGWIEGEDITAAYEGQDQGGDFNVLFIHTGGQSALGAYSDV
ncbi:tryptophan synthase beta subunit-like PLP-dependent enzyme [Aspergillus californicus]